MMVIRQLKEGEYERFTGFLQREARAEPLAASYTVDMKVNGVEYALRVQPGGRRQLAALQALRVERGRPGGFELITKGNILASLLELLIY